MNIYEEQNPFQGPTGGGGFNPVREPDVASAMERELRGGERRNQLFYRAMGENDQQRVRNAEAAAKAENAKIDQNLKMLGQFSKTVNNYLDQRTVGKIQQEMQAAAMLAWDDELYAEEETKKFEEEEAKIEEGQQIMDDAAVKYEANGGSPIVGEELRVSLTGRNRLAYERARMERLSMEYPSFLASKLSYINGTQDPTVRAQREREVLNEFMTRTGAIGTTPGMLNKYFMRNARKTMATEQLAWTTNTEKEILAGRLDEAQSELFTGVQSGNISSASAQFLTKLEGLGYSPLKRKEELFKFLKDPKNEQYLTDQNLEELAGTPIDHPSCKPGSECTFGKVFGRELDELEGLAANNQNVQLKRNAEKRAADQANFENQFQEALKAEGGELSFETIQDLREIARREGLDDGFLDNYQTAESYSLETAKRKLESIWQKQGFITENDLYGMPSNIRKDTDVAKWLDDGNLRSGESSTDTEAIETTTKRLANQISSLTSADELKGVEYDRIENEVRKDLNAQYMANLKSGKYRNPETGELNYGQALADARETVLTASQRSPEEGGKDYTKVATPIDIATRGNSRYTQRVSVYRNQLQSDPAFINNSLFSSNAELDQAQDALNGRGNFPAIYEDLAAGQVNVTAYDIAQAQMAKAGRKPEPQPVEEAVKAQSPELQRLLNFKPTPARTERVFTPNMNAPEVINKNLNTNARAFITTMRQLEGTSAGYDVVYGGARVPQLTSMTLRELHDAAKQGGTNRLPARLGGGRIPYKYDQYNSSASGALQLMPQTLAMLVQSGAFSWSDTFSPDTQDRMAIYLARGRGVDVNKPLTVRDFQRLAPEWASFGRYHGQTGRTAAQSHAIYMQNLRGK